MNEPTRSRATRTERLFCATLIALAASATIGAARASENHSTLHGKHIAGYQGWFTCPTDGASSGWRHWFRNNQPSSSDVLVDLWPDTADAPEGERCETGLPTSSGSKTYVFSSQRLATVDRHFRWMSEYDIDGVALQRFVSELPTLAGLRRRDKVLENVSASARAHQRAFFIMYDISGSPEGSWAETILKDWNYLITDKGILQDPSYWHHNGRPVLALWGLGFSDRPGTPTKAQELLKALRRNTPTGLTLVGGVPSAWRTLTRDSKSEPEWTKVYKSFDIISPWTIGRYGNSQTWHAYLRDYVDPDLREISAGDIEYLPVVFPGFSFANTSHDPSMFRRIPRQCGQFYTMQVNDLMSRNIDMLYTAMFDEVDEGTAIFKFADDESSPANVKLINKDACVTSRDHYLKLGHNASEMLHRKYKSRITQQ